MDLVSLPFHTTHLNEHEQEASDTARPLSDQVVLLQVKCSPEAGGLNFEHHWVEGGVILKEFKRDMSGNTQNVAVTCANEVAFGRGVVK